MWSWSGPTPPLTDDTAENVVEAFPGSAVFDCDDVAGFFNDADAVFVALAAFADRAELLVGEIEAAFAIMDAVAAGGDGIGEGVGDFLRLLQQMIGETLSAAAADAGQSRKCVRSSRRWRPGRAALEEPAMPPGSFMPLVRAPCVLQKASAHWRRRRWWQRR